jgi:hypothetical protein
MKKIINEVLFGKDAKISGFIALTVIMMIALGCTCGSLDKFKEGSNDNKDNKSTENKSKDDSASSNKSSKDSPFPTDEATPKKTEDVGKKKSSDKNMPSEVETESLVKDLVQQFKKGVEAEDFSDMRDSASTAFKKTYTAEKVNSEFDVFIKAKERVGTILEDVDSLTPTYTTDPSISTKNGYKLLTVNGTYPTSPTTTFNTLFVLEKGQWKMLTIEMKFQ